MITYIKKGTRKWQMKERGEGASSIFISLQSASVQKEMEKRQQSMPVERTSKGAEERERGMGAGRAGEGGSVRE